MQRKKDTSLVRCSNAEFRIGRKSYGGPVIAGISSKFRGVDEMEACVVVGGSR